MSSSKQGLISRIFGRHKPEQVAQQITSSTAIEFGSIPSSVSSMIATSGRVMRSRDQLYSKWAQMEAHPIIPPALQLLSTAALGGHETSGQIVFIEATPEAEKDKKTKAMVDRISKELTPLFNKVAFQLTYTSAAFGDAYARINTRPKEGVVDLYIGELLRPPMVQPFDRAGKTQGYIVYAGQDMFEKFDALQIARMKLPRFSYLPQHGDIQKGYFSTLTKDDPDDWLLMPDSVGGSLLIPAEQSFDNLNSALLGLMGQRWLDSIDEQVLTANMDSMTVEQQKRYMTNITNMLKNSHEIAQQAIRENRPIMERIRHIIPVFGEKQLLTVQGTTSAPRASSIQIDDVMLHAKLLSGALGVDLSMLGFADQLSGGLGEGGFFRVSAQAAERGRILRVALAETFNHIVDVHMIKQGKDTFDPNNRPYAINFYGNISALESERQRTRLDAMSSGSTLVQTMQQLKELGANKEIMQTFLSAPCYLTKT